MIVGSYFSSRAPDRYIRPAITFVIFASGLKYAGLGTTSLGWVLCATLLASGGIWLALARPWNNGSRQKPSLAPAEEPAAPSPAEIST